jgi:hypothetical protein
MIVIEIVKLVQDQAWINVYLAQLKNFFIKIDVYILVLGNLL